MLGKIVGVLTLLLLLATVSAYGVARWYQESNSEKPLKTGVTFIAPYAEYLGLDAKETLNKTLQDLGVRQFRLVSYWNQIETSPGKYDFSELDWQFDAIEAREGTISLAIGLRQPRWPECHAPKFYDTSQTRLNWQPQLESYMQAVIERYKDSKALVSYQLENEYFNRFGDCKNFDRDRLSQELALVKRLDSSRPVIISRSNNYAGFALRDPLADINALSLYRRVWDAQFTKKYFTYPFPSWHYAFLAGAQKILKGQESIIHELQTEPWPARGKNIIDTSLEEHNKSFDVERFKSTTSFAEQTGIKYVDLWGVEYWLYRKQVLNDASVWDAAKDYFTKHNSTNS